MKCNKCDTVNEEGMNFCVNCGNKLEKIETPTPVEETTPVVPATPEMPELPTLAKEKTAVVEEPKVEEPTPVEEPVKVAEPVVEEEEITGPLLEPITTPPLAPSLLATQVLPTITPEEVAATPEPTPVVEAPVVEEPAPAAEVPTPVVEAPAAPVVETPVPAPQPVAPAPKEKVTTHKKGFNKKLLIPIIGVVALVAIIAVVLMLTNTESNISENKILEAKLALDPDRLILVEKDDKYGYISTKGKEKIDFKYDYADGFEDGYAVVGTEPTDGSYNDYDYQIINEKGKEQLKESTDSLPKYYAAYSMWIIDGKLYDKKLNQLSDNDQTIDYLGHGYSSYTDYEKDESGIMNNEGKSIWKWDGTLMIAEISESEYTDDDIYINVTRFNEKSVIISTKKKKIVYEIENAKDNGITAYDNGIFEVYDTTSFETHTRLFFYNGKKAYESTNSNEGTINIHDYDEHLIRMYDNTKSEYKYYNFKKGKYVTDIEAYDEDKSLEKLLERQYGFTIKDESGKSGIVQDGKEVIPCKYNEIALLEYKVFLYMKEEKNKEIVLAKTDKEAILLNVKNGKEIAKFTADYIGMSTTSPFLKIEQYDGDKITIYNLITGEQKEFDDSAEIGIGSNHLTVEQDGKTTFYNNDLESIYTIED